MESKSEELIKRIQAGVIPWSDDIKGKRMFGGFCILYKGKMIVNRSNFFYCLHLAALPGLLSQTYRPHLTFWDVWFEFGQGINPAQTMSCQRECTS